MGSTHNSSWSLEQGITAVKIVKSCVTFGCSNSDAKAAYREKKLLFMDFH
jgi:hypothetical protein